jgi:hypothetical protein
LFEYAERLNCFVSGVEERDHCRPFSLGLAPTKEELDERLRNAGLPKRIEGAVRRVWAGITVKEDVTDVTL